MSFILSSMLKLFDSLIVLQTSHLAIPVTFCSSDIPRQCATNTGNSWSLKEVLKSVLIFTMV